MCCSCHKRFQKAKKSIIFNDFLKSTIDVVAVKASLHYWTLRLYMVAWQVRCVAFALGTSVASSHQLDLKDETRGQPV